ncbi:hypothetical protein ACFQ48_06620 [Hymenobacter caeli]|uniref:HEAT repeat domain-containing protein n=1 Tax=Hymenobacter caeli TaxID=2735894 RepID=A0ABX2FNV6_9BACT|nr:hypothetical protein [Hymenobacter caeli]NRT18855.1 hypothetical protein [Hymenobacter caeli]
MEIHNLLHHLAYGNAEESAAAAHNFVTNDATLTQYKKLTATLIKANDSRIVFWGLDVLIKNFPLQLQQDGEALIPWLLSNLTHESFPVVDRVVWALSVIGVAAVDALIYTVEQTSNPVHQAACLGALRRNHHLYLRAKQVLALLAASLGSATAEVRHWAMITSMDISPLRSWFDERMQPQDFEPLYRLVLPVAQEFIDSTQDDIYIRYRDLITQHLANNQAR